METLEKIGSYELAEKLIKSGPEYSEYEIPEFQFINSGSYRRVFKGPDGFAYKRNIYPGTLRRRMGYNWYENKTFTHLRDNGYVWVPNFTLYEFDDEDIMVVSYLCNPKISDLTSPEANTQRHSEIRAKVLDSDNSNLGVDPESGLIYLRDGGNGTIGLGFS